MNFCSDSSFIWVSYFVPVQTLSLTQFVDDVENRSAINNGLLHGISQAIQLAEESIGSTAPNPPVGCAILDRAGHILSVAAHRGAGTAHAEVTALELCRQSGNLEDAHCLFVTLEPCNHYGRTGPCTEAILASPIRRVIFGVADPNPHVAGGGQARLCGEGVHCDALSAVLPDQKHLIDQCAELIAPFAKRCSAGLPWVTVKQVLDRAGSMIPPPGRKTFSSEASLEYAHLLRRRSDAIMTGAGTVLADAPLLTVRRVADHPNRRRRLLIMDRTGRTPSAYLPGARARGLDPMVGQDIEVSLRRLAAEGCLRVLFEAGPSLTHAILETDLWDEWVLIRQGPSETAPDTIDVLRRRADDLGTDASLHVQKESV